jgi:hypothetical protein
MSEFLDQSEIDRLEFALSEITVKKEKSISAIQKIKQMYFTIVKQYCENKFDSLEDIGNVITVIGNYIKQNNEYYSSFIMLKNSYLERTK